MKQYELLLVQSDLSFASPWSKMHNNLHCFSTEVCSFYDVPAATDYSIMEILHQSTTHLNLIAQKLRVTHLSIQRNNKVKYWSYSLAVHPFH